MQNAVINVLLIDDDREYAEVTRHLLSRYQHRKFKLVCELDGESGIQRLRSKGDFDIVIIDYFLPGYNGIEVVKKLREQDMTTPVMFLTTHKNFEIAIEALRQGVQDYVLKDAVSEDVLPQTILSVLERCRLSEKRAEQERRQLLARRRVEAIRELVVTINHEINNPLATIKISMDIISRQALNADERSFFDEFLHEVNVIEKELAQMRNNQSAPDT